MQLQHWFGMIVVLVIGYYLGKNYPQWGAKVGI